MIRDRSLIVFFFLFFGPCTHVSASPQITFDSGDTTLATTPTVAPPALSGFVWAGARLWKRHEGDDSEICGFHDGNPDRPRTAEEGLECRIDTERGLWGFCPTTVIAASDCGLADNCVDKHACSRGCGIRGTSDITTFTCERDQFCSTVILALDDDAGFSYIACGATALTHTIYPTPTGASETRATESSDTASSSSESAAPSEPRESTTASSEPEAASGGEDSGRTNKTGAIIGGVIGGLALVCISAVAIVYLLRRNRNHKARDKSPQPQGSPMPAYYTSSTRDHILKEGPQSLSELEGQRNNKPSELPG